jgi:diguanylate cyclase (GGDEF)-like protein/PAS domain S-box-containing protein
MVDTSGQAKRHKLARRFKLTAVALGCSLIALVVATAFLAQQAQLVRQAMVAHTALGGWVARLQQVSLTIGEAESAQRGYLLTGKDEYLAPYRQAVIRLPGILDSLDTIPIDDPVLAAQVRDIRHQTDLKLAELAQTVSLYQKGRREAALALVQTDSGQHFMDRVRADVATGIAIVVANKSALNARVVSGSDSTESLGILTVAALVATLMLAKVQFGALMTAQRRYEDELVAGRRELNRQAATLEAIVDAMPAMVGVCDPDLNYTLVNRAYERWRGQGREQFVGRTLQQMLNPVEFERSLPWIQRTLSGETVSYEVEHAWDAEARHLAITYIPLRLGDGSIGGFIGIAEDITQHREENLRLLLLAERDPLTGLLNKAGFEAYLTKKVGHGEASTLAILYIDLDRFKPINDTHGHAAGDEVLRQFAMRLHGVVRPTDAVARLGGDEFVVVLAGIREAKNAAMVAEKIVKLAAQPISLGDQDVVAGASIGVACNADMEGGWKGLVARADEMAYRAKAEGRGRYVLAPEEVPRLAARQLRAS